MLKIFKRKENGPKKEEQVNVTRSGLMSMGGRPCQHQW